MGAADPWDWAVSADQPEMGNSADRGLAAQAQGREAQGREVQGREVQAMKVDRRYPEVMTTKSHPAAKATLGKYHEAFRLA